MMKYLAAAPFNLPRAGALSVLMGLLAVGSVGAAPNPDCNLNPIRTSLTTLRSAEQFSDLKWKDGTYSENVTMTRTDAGDSRDRVVAKDETVFSATFQHLKVHGESSMEAPIEFTFRSKWPLNPQFFFEATDGFPIKGVYTVPGGERYLALRVRDPTLTFFAREDGTLCNKVLNSIPQGNVFLAGKYVTSPPTQLRMRELRRDVDPPRDLRIVYVGSSGGIATYRAFWSHAGRIEKTRDFQYDPKATEVKIAGLVVPVSNATADSVTIGEILTSEEIARDTYWSTAFD